MENCSRKCVPFCLRSLGRFERCERTLAEELHSPVQRILSNAANVIVWHYEICPFDRNLSSFDPSLEKMRLIFHIFLVIVVYCIRTLFPTEMILVLFFHVGVIIDCSVTSSIG